MQGKRTIKKDFYLLVIKIVIYTIISSILAYTSLIIFTILSTDHIKPSNHYEKYLNNIEKDITNNIDEILSGNLINLDKYSNNIKGEVVDLNGNHIYGDKKILNDKNYILKNLGISKVDSNYIYKTIPLIKNDSIKYIYVLKAPFGYIINNISDNPAIVIIYISVIISPLIFFAIYLLFFTKKLYKSISQNIKILLDTSKEISNGNYLHQIKGLQGEEFINIQKSFNLMIEALKNTSEGVSKLEKERQLIISSIAHDIRTPITVINGQIEIINEFKENKNFKINHYINTIKKNCDKMTYLTDNLVLIYKVDNLDCLFRVQKINLKELLDDKRIELTSLVNTNLIKIEFDVKLIKKYYYLDESMLNRVLDNILINSIRFTESGFIKLSVFDENNKIHFKCEDSGVGFNKKDINNLFLAFYQNESYKNHFGLGLYIAKKIIINYKGKIKVYNNSYGGATVEFFIEELIENNILSKI